MKIKYNKGFTLAELLIVIAIISLLSSIVIIAASGAREKARIAKARNFSAQIHHALGADGMVFFDCNNENPRHLNNNDIIKDYSGNDNNGVIKYNGGGSADIISNCINGNCLNFSGNGRLSGAGLWVSSSNKLDCVNKITIQAWINPSSISYTTAIIDRHYTSGTGTPYSIYSIVISPPHYIGFFIRFDDNSSNSVWNSDDKPIEINKWQHIAATYNGSSMKLFINGEEAGKSDVPGNKKIRQSTYPLGIGVFSAGDGYYFNGSIDEAYIYCDGF